MGKMGEESRSESKLAQFQKSVNDFLNDDQNPFAQVFAMAEKYSQNKVKRIHAFGGKHFTWLDNIVINEMFSCLRVCCLVSSIRIRCSLACQPDRICVSSV